MHCQLRKLFLDSPETIDKLFISADNTLALTDPEGGVRLYALSDDHDEPAIATSYQDHKGPVMAVAFTSLSHPFYILTVSYDRSISLRSKESQVFGYKEEDATVGFFVACCFVRTENNVLRFLVGSSNGYVLDFDSRNGFEPMKHALFGENIVGLSAVDDDCVVVCPGGSAPRMYADRSFQDYVELESDSGKSKYKSVSVVGDRQEASVLLVNENGSIDVLRVNRDDNSVHKEASFELSQKVLSTSWNFSKHSANVLVFDSESDQIEVRVIKEDLEKAGQWRIVEVKTEKSE